MINDHEKGQRRRPRKAVGEALIINISFKAYIKILMFTSESKCKVAVKQMFV